MYRTCLTEDNYSMDKLCINFDKKYLLFWKMSGFNITAKSCSCTSHALLYYNCDAFILIDCYHLFTPVVVTYRIQRNGVIDVVSVKLVGSHNVVSL